MTSKSTNRSFAIAVIALAALSVLGIGCWVAQLVSGEHLLNLNDTAMWGIYLAAFTVATGISAGSLLFVGCAMIVPLFKCWMPYTRLAAVAGVLGGAVAAGLFITADLGSPVRAWEIIAMAHPGSPLFWDTMILGAYVVLGVVLAVVLGKAGAGDGARAKVLGAICLVAGLCVAITSYVFAFQVSQPLWNNPGQVLSFILVAVMASMAFLSIVIELGAKIGIVPEGREALRLMGFAAGVAAILEIVFMLSEIALGLFAAGGDHLASAAWMTAGEGATLFWVQLIAVIAAAVLLIMSRGSAMRLAGSASALIGALLIKWNLLQAALLNPLIGFAAYPGSTEPVATGLCMPSLVEWGVCVGVIAIAALGCTIALGKFKLASMHE